MPNPLLATVLLGLSVCALAPQSARRATLPPSCVNAIQREPLVLYEVTGGTLTGPLDAFLTVHNDGSARLSSFLGGAGAGTSQFVSLAFSEVQDLRQALIGAGALLECDQPDTVSDTPLQTLTVFQGGRRSHTFSWWSSDGNLAVIEGILADFMAAHFAPLSGGGGASRGR